MEAREDLIRRFSPWLACFAFLAATLRVFDWSYLDARSRNAVMADNLIYYEMILDRVRHGDSLLGRTLLPSPYFVDLILQLPLALGTQDFEHFAYDLALLYCGLLFSGLFLLCRRNLGMGVTAAAACAGLAVGAYYRLAPGELLAHVFIQNHVSEIFCGLVAASYVVSVIRHGGRSVLVHATFVAFNVASSAFFVTTYVLPVLLGAGALLGTAGIRLQRLALFVATTVAATFAGIAFDAVLSAKLWPIRGDEYTFTPRQSLDIFLAVVREQFLPLAAAVLAAALVALVLAIVLRLRMRTTGERHAGAVLLLVFGVTALATCVAMPIVRGAFMGRYELRYVQEPALLATFLVAAALVLGLGRIARRAPR